MEKDGVSRIYVTTGGEPYARELFPVSQEEELKGDAASEVLQRADYRGVYHWKGRYARKPGEVGRTDFEGYGFEDPDTHTIFDISTQKAGTFTPSGHKVVIEALEQKSGKTGLTIVVS